MRFFLRLLMIGVCFTEVIYSPLQAQNAVVTDDPAYTGNSAAILDVKSINKGFLVPRLTTAQMNGISSPVAGLLVFNTTLNGFCYYSGVEWITLSSQLLPSNAGLDEPLFKILNAAGDTVFAVFPEGIRIKVGDGIAKGSGNKGGFAVGGFGTGKIISQEYLRITNDSVRIYVNPNPPKGSGNKGGFAVGGFGTGKTQPENFMHLNPDNYFIGYQSGKSINGGLYNSFMGYQTGPLVTTGSYNLLLGYQAGNSLTIGNNNVAMGFKAGLNLTSGRDNVFLGTEAGGSSNIGYENTFLGYWAGKNNSSGYQNIAIGYYAGKGLTTNNANTLIGRSSGESLSSGSFNAFFGTFSGDLTTSGSYNTFIGYDCGFQSVTGSHNTFLGFQAGRGYGGIYMGDSSVFIGNEAGSYESGSNKLYISNSSTSSPLIWGDFKLLKVAINGKLGISTTNPGYSVEVYGINASLIAHNSGQARGGVSALNTNRVALLTTAPSNDLVFGYSTTNQSDFTTNFVERMRIDNSTGFVGIGNNAPSQMLHVQGNTYVAGSVIIGTSVTDGILNAEQGNGLVAMFNRRFSDGTVVSIRKDNAEVGTISVLAGVVSYNAFTGSHYGFTDHPVDVGKLVVLTGSNQRLNGLPGAEIIYGIKESSMPNDPAVLGAFLGLLESSRKPGHDNPYLIMAEGNGEIWIVDKGENLEPGDFLISSDIQGHAMKDMGNFQESYVVAKVAEPVDWQQVSSTIYGVKHAKISVIFTSFVRNNESIKLKNEIEILKSEVSAIKALLSQ